MRRGAMVSLAILLSGLACGEDGAPRGVVDSERAEAIEDGDAGPEGDDAPSGADASDTAEVVPELGVVPPIGGAVADPLANGGPSSCAVYLDETCEGGVARRCELYDTASAAFVDAPDPLVKRAYLYDRWYDLYHRPDGVTAEREFTSPMTPGTPESEWGARERFQGWAGVGDGAIWTGAALNAAALRYAATGTEADYARMVERTRDVLRLFDVTGISGYLARNPFIHMPDGGPSSDQHIVRFGALGPHDHAFDPATVPDLPAAYSEGVPDAEGTLWKGQAMWHGNPSIDQYTGPLVAFPIAWSLLRDDAIGADLKARMTRHLTCYLKRLRRIELVNLQSNTEALAAVQAFLAGGNLVLDPDDPDLGALDTIVAYVLEQPNAANADTFDRSCPDEIALGPSRVIDAASSSFLRDLLELVADSSPSDPPRAAAIDHIYAISVRGGDASHLLHLAAAAWLMSGEARYRDFLADELLGRLAVDRVTHTLGAFVNPRWCRSYYGDHITFGPHWALATTLAPGPLREDMLRQLDVELRGKLMAGLGNAKFALMYAAVAAHDPASRDAQRAEGMALLEAFGGARDHLDEPRRHYALPRAEVLAALPEDIAVECPSSEERTRCEAGFSLLGVSVPGEAITHACTGAPAECDMGDGTCADPMASRGLPPTLRRYADFMWQRNPFALGERGAEGRVQSPGLDLVEAFWLARAYGVTTRGAGQVLAWRERGGCAE